MRKLITHFALATFVALATLTGTSPAVPAPADKPIKWEYAELVARTGARGGMGKGGGPADNAQPGQPPILRNSIRLITADGEAAAETWEEMAEKLKAPAPKKEAPISVHKLRVFNQLGSEGWELIGNLGTSMSPAAAASGGTWTFKRRVP